MTNLGNCVPCEERGHDCPAVVMVKVGEESEPWCQSCKEGAKVCAYERAERAKAIGLPAKSAAAPDARQHQRVGVMAKIEDVAHSTARKAETAVAAPAEPKAAHKEPPPVHKETTPVHTPEPDTRKRCACGPGCDAFAMNRPGRIYAYGHSPKLAKRAPVVAAKKKREEKPPVETSTSDLPFKIKTFTRDEYKSKFAVERGRNEKLLSLVKFACKGKIGEVHIIEPEKNDSARRLRDRIRRTFVRHFSKNVEFDIYVSQNKKFNHVAIEKVSR